MAVVAAPIEVAAYIASLALQYGLPALLKILQEWKKVDPTMTDLTALKAIPIDPDAP